jgi:hypothetical protein
MSLKELKGNGRVWVYVSQRRLTAEEEQTIDQQLKNFFANWEAHGNRLTAGYELLEQQAIVLAVDEEAAGATGCSIDKATALIKEIDQHYQLDLFNRLILPVYAGDGLERWNLEDAKRAFQEGRISQETQVLNTTISQLKEIDQIRQPLKNNWIYPRLTRAIENAKT